MIPEIMSKVWTGADTEFFSFRDMVRVEYNANLCAKYAGVDEVSFQEVSRASQFRYDEAQKLEDLIKKIATALGVTVTSETTWGYNRTLSYVDFERWEAGIWKVYKALGGIGDRIPSDRILVNYHTTLFSNAWKGDGPFHIDVTLPAVNKGTEAMVFVSHTADLFQRQSELNALLRIELVGDNVVRFQALGLRPSQDLPVTIAIGGLQMHKELSLKSASWSGPDSGPWTQNVTVPQAAVEAVIGQWEGMSADAVAKMADARLHVSAINGTTVTVRAIGKKPTIDLNPMLMYDIASTEAE